MINKISSVNFPKYSYKKVSNTSISAQTKPMPFDTVSFKGKIHFEEKQKLFNDYEPQIKTFGTYSIPVHNNQIADRLKKTYTAEEFDSLFNFAQEKDVFKVRTDAPDGFIPTCEIENEEDPKMSGLIWVTDTCNFMPYLKDKHPELCVPLFEKLSVYYAGQQEAFNKIIKLPSRYQLNHDRKEKACHGVGHVFDPKTNQTHPHYPKARLDSIGLYLQTASDLILRGLNNREEYGYKSSDEVSDATINSIANCVKYLMSINYPNTKDTGAWEQWVFNTTPSSDVAILNQAFRSVIDLMYTNTDSKELRTVRKRIMNSPHGKVFLYKEELSDLLKVGEKRIKTNSVREVPGERDLDGAMSFIFKTEKLNNDVNENAKLVLKRLKSLETTKKKPNGIVRENGMIRYVGDNYLHLNQHILDTELERYNGPLFPVKTQAQWFMVSDMSKSYGVLAKSLIKYINQLDQRYSGGSDVIKELCGYDSKRKTASKLLEKSLEKQTEYINRSYARITGENSYKANGRPCPAFKVPEAYQSVRDAKGKVKFVPGTNTPLTWAQVSLYDASKRMQENLKLYEKLNHIENKPF